MHQRHCGDASPATFRAKLLMANREARRRGVETDMREIRSQPEIHAARRQLTGAAHRTGMVHAKMRVCGPTGAQQAGVKLSGAASKATGPCIVPTQTVMSASETGLAVTGADVEMPSVLPELRSALS